MNKTSQNAERADRGDSTRLKEIKAHDIQTHYAPHSL